MHKSPHQYVDRASGRPVTERLFQDRIVNLCYRQGREHAPAFFNALVSPRFSSLVGFLNYDLAIGARLTGGPRFLDELGLDLAECLDPVIELDTPRKVFERRIRYWETRPMPEEPSVAVCPSDSRVIVGSLDAGAPLFIKEKFFGYDELLGLDAGEWICRFAHGSFALFRLTPDKYHYNHAPVTGRIAGFYELDGLYHACNPSAIVAIATPYSKNRRSVTVIDTDVPGGTGCGMVAMGEVAALMIGQIVQAVSDYRYDDPRPADPGTMLQRGMPKSLFRPGSSTVVLLFEPGRIDFAPDLAANTRRTDVASRFTAGFGEPLVETDVAVRSPLGRALPPRTN